MVKILYEQWKNKRWFNIFEKEILILFRVSIRVLCYWKVELLIGKNWHLIYLLRLIEEYNSADMAFGNRKTGKVHDEWLNLWKRKLWLWALEVFKLIWRNQEEHKTDSGEARYANVTAFYFCKIYFLYS